MLDLFVLTAGNLVINPFDPSAHMQQWEITERKIQNRHSPSIVLQVRADDNAELSHKVTAAEYTGSELQQWDINHVYVFFLYSLHCALAAAQCIVIAPVCGWMGVFVYVWVWVCYHNNSKLRASILTKLGL